jgi:hypothetical protein
LYYLGTASRIQSAAITSFSSSAVIFEIAVCQLYQELPGKLKTGLDGPVSPLAPQQDYYQRPLPCWIIASRLPGYSSVTTHLECVVAAL